MKHNEEFASAGSLPVLRHTRQEMVCGEVCMPAYRHGYVCIRSAAAQLFHRSGTPSLVVGKGWGEMGRHMPQTNAGLPACQAMGTTQKHAPVPCDQVGVAGNVAFTQSRSGRHGGFWLGR